jgi:hypothetical protein
MLSPSEAPLSDAELKELLTQIRSVNHLHSLGRITTEQRVALHNRLVPGIGRLDPHSPDDSCATPDFGSILPASETDLSHTREE